MKIYDFLKADDQDMLEEKTNQNEEAAKVSTSVNAADVDRCEFDVDSKSLDEETLDKSIGEHINQEILVF